MRSLSASQVLQVWERGQRGSVNQALALLSTILPERSASELASLSLGARDALLLRLRESTLGPDLKAYTACTRCGATLDFTVSVSDVLVAGAAPPREEAFTTTEGFEIRFRPADSRDLEMAARADSVEAAHALLVRRVVLEARHGGARIDPANLPETALAELAERLEARDPQAEVPLALFCSLCKNEWHALLDIGSFFWSEVTALAERLLNEVHTLARYYGWSETEILALSPVRRQYYLDLVPAT